MPYRPDYAVDLDGIIASKGGHFPSFVVRWMKKFLHVDFLNEYFVQGLEGVEFWSKIGILQK
ncbi:MAG: hypothetical protein KBS53_04580 [Bacteroidales bacterium]|nr:hypothetical protein [Candidatus Hennigimonas equi]